MRESVKLFAELLAERGFIVTAIVGDSVTHATATAAMGKLRDDAQPGDAIALYFAGHGSLFWEEGNPAEVYPALLPMDAYESTAEDLRVIVGIELERWLDDVVRRVAVDGKANVTVVLECCHSAGLVSGRGVASDELERVRTFVGRVLQEKQTRRRQRRDSEGVGSQVVRVVAAGTFSRAYGSGPRTVGGATRAVIDLLRRFPTEPWQALEYRLRAKVHQTQPHQWPGIEGPRKRLPFTVEERPLPEGVLPCVTRAGGGWTCLQGVMLGINPGGLYWMTRDFVASNGTLARVNADRMSLTPLDGENGAPGRLEWALPMALASGVRVAVREEGAKLSSSIRQRLVDVGVRLVGPELAHRSSGPLIRLEVRARSFTVIDSWGQTVGRWTEEPELEGLLACLGRLAEIERWLSVSDMPSTLAGEFELRCHVTRGNNGVRGQKEVLTPGSLLHQGDELFVELHKVGFEPRLFLSVFRVTGSREIVHLTATEAGGIPCTGDSPAMLLPGENGVPLLGRDEFGSGEVHEALVAVVTIRPFSMHLMERGPVRRRPGESRPAVAMVVVRYRLSE
ncbi:MAG: caspase family protein [Myxococcota bacterium]